MLKDPPSKTDQEKAEQERFVFGEKTKVRYSNYDDEAGHVGGGGQTFSAEVTRWNTSSQAGRAGLVSFQNRIFT